MLNLNFEGVSESGVPAPGEYTVTCTEAVVNETKAGTGEYIKVKLETVDGPVFFHNFNIKNPNAKAVEIGMGQLKTFLRVAGKKDPNKLNGAEELIGLRCIVKVKVEDKGDEYGPQARITAFKPAAKKSADNPFA